MSHTTTSGPQGVQPTQVTAWVGWVAFAAFMMVLVGSFHIIQGLVALFRDEVFLVGSSGLVLNVDYTGWGITHIIGGAVLVAAGIWTFRGKVWARTVGVVMAMLSAVVNIGFLAAYPIWSAIMIAVDVMVIWALTVHGGELRD
jgi:hypothetical protein